MAEGTRSRTLESQFLEFREDMKSFRASTAKFITDSQKFQEEQLRQFEEFKKSNDQRLEQLEDFVRNPPDPGGQRGQQTESSSRFHRDRWNSVRGGSELMAADRTLLIKVRLELYPISWEILDEIFSKFGMIEYLEVFCRGEEYHSMIRFQKRESAMQAFESLNHREIYDNWCRLELFLLSLIEPPSLSNQEVTGEQHQITNQERAWRQESNQQFYRDPREIIDCDGRDAEEIQGGIPMTVGAPRLGDSPGIIDRESEVLSEIVLDTTTEIEDRDPEIDEILNDHLLCTIIVMTDALKEPENNDDIKEILTQRNCLKVNLDSSEFIIGDIAIKEVAELVNLVIELLEIRMANFRTNSFECLGNLSALKVFKKMPRIKGSMLVARVDEKLLVSYGMELTAIYWPYDRGKTKVVKGGRSESDKKYGGLCIDLGCQEVPWGILISVPAGMYTEIDSVGQSLLDRNLDFKLIDNGLKSLRFDNGLKMLHFVFDPGGILG